MQMKTEPGRAPFHFHPSGKYRIRFLIVCTFNSTCDSGTLNATLARGKIVICFQSRSQRSVATAARTVLAVQGVGLIFAQFPTKDVQFFFDIPSVLVDFVIATSLLTYMEASR